MRINHGPIEAIISLTNRCDARCKMCNIWKLSHNELLRADDYRALPRSLKNVNITGGEPLLRNDILEIIHAIYETCDSPRIILATNGFRTEKTIELVREITKYVPKLGIAISIDGLAHHHDELRGVPNAYSRATSTLMALQSLGIKDIRIGFTATPSNISQLPVVHKLSRELDVQFTATVAQNSEVYYGKTDNEQASVSDVERYFGYLIDCNLRSYIVKNWFRAYFEQGVISFVRDGKRMTACSAADDFFYLSPTGDVFPCLTLPNILGNIKHDSFISLWHSENALLIRELASKCQKCWMVCTARTEIKKHPIRAISWVAKEKLTRHVAGAK